MGLIDIKVFCIIPLSIFNPPITTCAIIKILFDILECKIRFRSEEKTEIKNPKKACYVFMLVFMLVAIIMLKYCHRSHILIIALIQLYFIIQIKHFREHNPPKSAFFNFSPKLFLNINWVD